MLQDDPSQGDAQLVNSAYLDNDSAELYHGRLDKKPNALALRLRWCALLPLIGLEAERPRPAPALVRPPATDWTRSRTPSPCACAGAPSCHCFTYSRCVACNVQTAALTH